MGWGGGEGGCTDLSICFAKLQQNGLNSDIDRLNSNKSNLFGHFTVA